MNCQCCDSNPCLEALDNNREGDSPVYRIYDISRDTGMTSQDVRKFLYLYSNRKYATPSHRVPLPIAIRFIEWVRSNRVSPRIFADGGM